MQTRGVISDLFALCPNAKTATEVDKQEIETLIKHHDRTVFSGVSSRELDSCHSTAWRWKRNYQQVCMQLMHMHYSVMDVG
ncbi:hypothetical protein F2Q69_00038989 [Brassica cretica]|uniref:Uncharacterized protein n=1 Tax=Brassica cretica TaxID=69181 RepID=A0A8S9SM03_BRACR|nr:hypothetical protein F2Q69_00038989 [Brassica cretica]